jgi:hypothetical protein
MAKRKPKPKSKIIRKPVEVPINEWFAKQDRVYKKRLVTKYGFPKEMFEAKGEK